MTASLRVAIADDEPDMRDYLQRLLPRLGHTVVASAACGSELLAAVRDTHPDLIITDVRMPDMGGDAALRTIWIEEPIPAIVISAYEPPSTLMAASSDCRYTYLNKPFKWTDLEAAIIALCQGTGDDKTP